MEEQQDRKEGKGGRGRGLCRGQDYHLGLVAFPQHSVELEEPRTGPGLLNRNRTWSRAGSTHPHHLYQLSSKIQSGILPTSQQGTHNSRTSNTDRRAWNRLDRYWVTVRRRMRQMVHAREEEGGSLVNQRRDNGRDGGPMSNFFHNF